YVRIHAWDRHQRVDNRGRPRVPTPEQDDGTWNRALAGDFAETRGEPPRTSASLDTSPLARAPAHDRRETTDLRPPTPTTDPGPAASRGERPRRSSPKNRTTVPADFAPSPQILAWASQQGEGVDASALVEEFVEHWVSVGEKRADWRLTFKKRI